jgi:hypothetical protein
MPPEEVERVVTADAGVRRLFDDASNRPSWESFGTS